VLRLLRVGPEGEITIAKLDIAALALVAALISGVGDVVRQRSAQEVTDEEVGHVELLRVSLRDTRWWLGGGAAVASAALQAVALGLGSVVLVPALRVTALRVRLAGLRVADQEGADAPGRRQAIHRRPPNNGGAGCCLSSRGGRDQPGTAKGGFTKVCHGRSIDGPSGPITVGTRPPSHYSCR
jgi:hypothetical protein